LPDRLNDTDTIVNTVSETLDDTLNRILVPFGNLTFPSSFKFNFDVTKISKRKYVHNATPESVYDWSNAIEIFISSINTTGGLGDNHRFPVTLTRFVANYTSGLYGNKKDFILTFITGLYDANAQLSLNNLDCNLYIRSGSASGRTWIGRFLSSLSGTNTITGWLPYESIFKTSIVGTVYTINSVINPNEVDAFGVPQVYEKVSTLELCLNKEGTFFQVNGDVYVNKYKNNVIDDCLLHVQQTYINLTGWVGDTIVIENICSPNNSILFSMNSVNRKVYIFNCLFFRSATHAFSVNGAYRIFLFDCVSAFSTVDCFNYHATTPESIAIEMNCVGYGAGQFKDGAGSGRHSNNGSTAHDGMNIARIGGRYWNCEGPTIADVNNCNSLTLGCTVGEILATTTGHKSAVLMNNETAESGSNKQLIFETFANGKNINFGIDGTETTFYGDLEGNTSINGDVTNVVWGGV
jgi:hypothetical protein